MIVREIGLGLLPRPLPVNRAIFTGGTERERDNEQLLLSNIARDFLICCCSSWEDGASRICLSCRLKWEESGLHILQVFSECETAEPQAWTPLCPGLHIHRDIYGIGKEEMSLSIAKPLLSSPWCGQRSGLRRAGSRATQGLSTEEMVPAASW